MKMERRYIVTPIILIILIIGTLFFINFNSINNRLASSEKSTPLPTPEGSNIPEIKKQLLAPPEVVKAIYVTSWSATREDYIDYIFNLARRKKINSVVIDIKDWSGYVAYDTKVPDVEIYSAKSVRIKNINSLVQTLHEEQIYVIARIAVFQDPRLALARPDLAVHSKSKLASSTFSSSTLWLDKSGLAWIDPAAKTAWEYNIAIAKDALSQGFDEINFDYVRFPSDGDLKDMVFPLWDGKTPKHLVIKDFFKYLRQELPDAKLSVDLFGLSTVNFDDLGVGQVIEDAFEYFDYVSPMIYPSHYAPGFLGYQNPAEYPYEVVKYSMDNALERLSIYKQMQKRNVQLRPWLQDFDLGAVYDAEMIKSEIRAVYDAARENFKGFMLWNSSNIYTEGALEL
ncbi:MAG: Uncharacterized protein G01um101430_691 [Parcubacteria group bacterium Gr01-1014_30]|nr:MAG: Uncharacterized protein G01um101430_691 [Parcubacteria group bacterium Gr01-1014_30]